MPIVEEVKMKQRDFKTLRRIEAAQKSSSVLRSFFEEGFKSFDALKAIVMFYNPEMNQVRLYDFWHFRIIDEDVCKILENVFEKLKAE